VARLSCPGVPKESCQRCHLNITALHWKAVQNGTDSGQQATSYNISIRFLLKRDLNQPKSWHTSCRPNIQISDMTTATVNPYFLVLLKSWNCSRLIATFWQITSTNKSTYLLTPWSSVHLVKQTGLKLVKNFTAYYGTRRFIKAFTSAATCPYPKPARSSPYATYQFLKIHLNIIFTSTSGSPQWSLTFSYANQNPVQASPFPIPYTCFAQFIKNKEHDK